MKKRANLIAALLLALSVLLTACGGNGTGTDHTTYPTSGSTESSTAAPDKSGYEFSKRDLDSSYDSVTATVTLSDSGSTVDGSGITVDGGCITVTAAGTYLISGTLSSGTITVAAGEEDKVQLVLSGVSVTNPDGPALYVKSADKVFLTLAADTENTLSDGSGAAATDDGKNLDGTVFSRADLTINGSGGLTVHGNSKHGVVSKDDLVITGGVITVTAQNVALSGKDCVKITNTTLDLTAGTDGIRSDNDEDESRGYIYIKDGNITVDAGTDGIQAQTVLYVAGGTLDIVSGGGSANASTHSGWGMWGAGASTDSSAKGLKAGAELTVSGGEITVDSSDDCLHSNGIMTVAGGKLNLSSGDDGAHADTALTISGGDVDIIKCYEGVESTDITVSGGVLSIVASDDGLNAAGGNDGSAMGGRPGMGGFSSSTGTLTITGGYIVIDAQGDGLDANGTITVTGGVTLVSGPTNDGNGALDYDGGATVTGGIVIALGSAGMAMNFSSAENQGSMLATFNTQSGGTSFAVLDGSGNVVASFTPAKSYTCATVTAPGIRAGETYTLVAGGNVSGADANGYSGSGTITGGTTLAMVEMTSTVTGGGMGMGGPGGMGGHGGGPGGPGGGPGGPGGGFGHP